MLLKKKMFRFVRENNPILKLYHYRFRNWENKIKNYKYNTLNKYYTEERKKFLLLFNNYNIIKNNPTFQNERHLYLKYGILKEISGEDSGKNRYID